MVNGVQANLKELQYLSLNFILCDKITSQVKEALAGSLSFVNSRKIEF